MIWILRPDGTKARLTVPREDFTDSNLEYLYTIRDETGAHAIYRWKGADLPRIPQPGYTLGDYCNEFGYQPGRFAARGTARATRAARPPDGVTLRANEALDLATSFLGEGYREIAPGVFRSANNTRQVRMTASDLARPRNHAGAPHFNFEEGRLVTRPDGRQTFRVDPGGNSHVIIDPRDL